MNPNVSDTSFFGNDPTTDTDADRLQEAMKRLRLIRKEAHFLLGADYDSATGDETLKEIIALVDGVSDQLTHEPDPETGGLRPRRVVYLER